MISFSNKKVNYKIGQKFKNSPTDKEPFFELINISESLGGLKYYRVKSLYSDLELVLHDEDLYPI